MPTFYFDIVQIDGTYTQDTVGTEFPSLKAAQEEAKRCLAEMSVEAINRVLSELCIEVRDSLGRQVARRAAYFSSEDVE